MLRWAQGERLNRGAADVRGLGCGEDMRIPEGKWLLPISCGVIALSVLETAVFTSGDLDRRAGLAVLSFMSVLLGLAASILVLGGHYTLARATSSAMPGYAKMIDGLSALCFWFGVVVAPLAVLLHPFGLHDQRQGMPISMAPVGIGFAWGAKWIHKRYSGEHGPANATDRPDAAPPGEGDGRDTE